MYRFEKLLIWKLSIDVVKDVYKYNQSLPHQEKKNLVDKITRSATSEALNIVEGSASGTDKEFRRYLIIARKSLIETIAILRIIHIMYKIEDSEIEIKTNRLIKQFNAFIKLLANSQKL